MLAWVSNGSSFSLTAFLRITVCDLRDALFHRRHRLAEIWRKLDFMTAVREARPSEFDEIGRLTYAGFGHAEPGARRPAPERLHLLLNAEARARQGTLLVAEDGGHLIGTATLLPGDAALSRQARSAAESELRLLAVLPQARSTGAGWQLMRAAIERSAAAGARALVLDTGPRNFTSQRLYHRLGFERAPERETQPSLSGEPLAVFVYDFSPSDPLLVRLARPDEYEHAAPSIWAAAGLGAPEQLSALAHEHELWVVERRDDHRLIGAVVTVRPDPAADPNAVLAPIAHPFAVVEQRPVVAERLEAHLAAVRQVRQRLHQHTVSA